MSLVLAFLMGIIVTAIVGILLPSKRKPIDCSEFEIYDDGFDEGIKTAADLVENLAKISESSDQALRHAALIRQLKRRIP